MKCSAGTKSVSSEEFMREQKVHRETVKKASKNLKLTETGGSMIGPQFNPGVRRREKDRSL